MTGKFDSPFIHPRQRVDFFGAERESKQFPSLSPDLTGSSKADKLRICIITRDFIGPIKNGGIGTAYTYAAQAFAQAGHDVTVLFCLNVSAEKTLSYWSDFYSKQGINFVPITEPEIEAVKGPVNAAGADSYAAYEWLKNQTEEFDFIHVSEWSALGYYSLQAKAAGMHFQNSKFVVKCSSPTLWNRIGNAEPITDVQVLSLMFMERRSVELADYVISGSNYLLNWMREQGYQLPEKTFVQPNIFPVDKVSIDKAYDKKLPVSELVFFGRLEPRKGIHYFVDCLINLRNSGRISAEKETKVTLLGKERPGFSIKRHIKRLEAAGYTVQLLNNKSQPEALQYLKSGFGRIAIMPSVMDNSPFGVYECLANGIPFITSNTGGGKELINTSDWDNTLFVPAPNAIANKIIDVLENGCITPKPSFDFSENITQWLAWHQEVSTSNNVVAAAEIDTNTPLVSVCMAHHNRGPLLYNAIESIQKQTYSNIEIIVVDDGSSKPEALQTLKDIEQQEFKFPVKIVRQENKYLGAVRNNGIANASGEYILFMDDDNEAKAHEIETFVKAALHTNAEVLTCWSDQFAGERPELSTVNIQRIIFHGENLAAGLVRNPFGDSNCFVKKSAAEELNGFTEHFKVGLDDCEFFSRAILSGMRVFLVPEALYWYRLSEVRMRHGQYNLFAGRVRLLEPYTQDMHPDLANIIRYAAGMGYVYGPWGKPPQENQPSSIKMKLIEFGRKLIAKYPGVYPLAKKIHAKFF